MTGSAPTLTDDLRVRVHAAIGAWCERELAARRQDHAAATYSGGSTAAASYAAGASDSELELDEFTEEELELLAELVAGAERRVRTWQDSGWLAPADRGQLLLDAHAEAAGIPHEHAEQRSAAMATVEALQFWCDSAPATEPAANERPTPPSPKPHAPRRARKTVDVDQGALFTLPE
ncbi:hypothetical protein CFN78_22580 [Amycolatopsis antarctica]|uniref:Uncharacterized protein n=1 Tax=Amycolatopsis antarctica TaxID=1854586 RepID=A0A263CXW4_9PSEU|nr:hypothetical protein [Amycolatopsis antarctica]OZM70941.1 hypothetical protein CFN78_22580 [Amycolatopsis antarctica]